MQHPLNGSGTTKALFESANSTAEVRVEYTRLSYQDEANYRLLARRVKCDEAFPSCYKCVSTGRLCDGYGPNSEAPPIVFSAFSSSTRLLCPGMQGTSKERQCFDFFQTKTAPQLSKFLRSDFWETILLQSALREESIKHAIIALGSLHKTSDVDNGLNIKRHAYRYTDDFALKNYTQAINILIGSHSSSSLTAIDVCVVCSVLFACLEVSCFRIPASIMLILNRQCKAAMAPLSPT